MGESSNNNTTNANTHSESEIHSHTFIHKHTSMSNEQTTVEYLQSAKRLELLIDTPVDRAFNFEHVSEQVFIAG